MMTQLTVISILMVVCIGGIVYSAPCFEQHHPLCAPAPPHSACPPAHPKEDHCREKDHSKEKKHHKKCKDKKKKKKDKKKCDHEDKSVSIEIDVDINIYGEVFTNNKYVDNSEGDIYLVWMNKCTREQLEYIDIVVDYLEIHESLATEIIDYEILQKNINAVYKILKSENIYSAKVDLYAQKTVFEKVKQQLFQAMSGLSEQSELYIALNYCVNTEISIMPIIVGLCRSVVISQETYFSHSATRSVSSSCDIHCACKERDSSEEKHKKKECKDHSKEKKEKKKECEDHSKEEKHTKKECKDHSKEKKEKKKECEDHSKEEKHKNKKECKDHSKEKKEKKKECEDHSKEEKHKKKECKDHSKEKKEKKKEYEDHSKEEKHEKCKEKEKKKEKKKCDDHSKEEKHHEKKCENKEKKKEHQKSHNKNSSSSHENISVNIDIDINFYGEVFTENKYVDNSERDVYLTWMNKCTKDELEYISIIVKYLQTQEALSAEIIDYQLFQKSICSIYEIFQKSNIYSAYTDLYAQTDIFEKVKMQVVEAMNGLSEESALYTVLNYCTQKEVTMMPMVVGLCRSVAMSQETYFSQTSTSYTSATSFY